MIKLAGISALSLAIWLYSVFLSSGIKKKIAFEDGLVTLLSHIKTMIHAEGMPLSKIYESFSERALDSGGFTEKLKKGGCSPLREALESSGKEFFADDGIRSLALSFSEQIGACPSAADGEALCEKYIALIKERICAVRQQDITRAALYGKLGVIAAAFVFLMFI